MAYGTAVSRVVIHLIFNILMIKWSNSPKFTTVQQSFNQKSNHPDFQTCNVRSTESDHINTVRQLC